MIWVKVRAGCKVTGCCFDTPEETLHTVEADLGIKNQNLRVLFRSPDRSSPKLCRRSYLSFYSFFRNFPISFMLTSIIRSVLWCADARCSWSQTLLFGDEFEQFVLDVTVANQLSLSPYSNLWTVLVCDELLRLWNSGLVGGVPKRLTL